MPPIAERHARYTFVVAVVTLASCGTEPVALNVRFADPAVGTRTEVVEITIAEGACGAGGAVVQTLVVRRDMAAGVPDTLEPGSYSITARARTTDCVGLAEACVEIDSDRDDAIELVLQNASVEEPDCLASECTDGLCGCPGRQTRCGDDCVRLDTNSDHCGGCGTRCGGPQFCVEGECSIDCPNTVCRPPDDSPVCADLDTDEAHCGGCNTMCALANTTPTCAGGACQAACLDGYGDCDTVTDTGCEIDLNTDPAHCGGCGAACDLPNATPGCSGGDCVVATCDAGFDDCNGNPDDGCETPLSTPTDCGACGRGCGLGGECFGGRCDDEVAQVDAGCGYTCARTHGGQLVCWGRNGVEQRGVRRVEQNRANLVPIPEIVDFSAGGRHACAVLTSGEIMCWGRGDDGLIGDGTNRTAINARVPPTLVSGIDDAVAVTVSNGAGFGRMGCDSPCAHACALRSTGEVWCWGENGVAQLGNTTMPESDVPVPVAGIVDATSIEAGTWHTCATLEDGSVSCWGDNEHLQSGDPAGGTVLPTTVTGAAGAVTLGALTHTCAAIGSELRCWGANTLGQRGVASVVDTAVPTAALLPAGVGAPIAVATGGSNTAGYTCTVARPAAGAASLFCFGDNAACHTGVNCPVSGGVGAFHVPAEVSTPTEPTAVTAGCDHTCILDVDGSVWCWGENFDAELGAGWSQRPDDGVRLQASEIRGAVDVAAGSLHTCARRLNGRVTCWGRNDDFQLGDGTGMVRVEPVLNGTTDATDVQAGGDHGCAIVRDGTAVCWGHNGSGELGDGTRVFRSDPATVVGLTDVTAIALGNRPNAHTCALANGGLIYCWGADDVGQIPTRPTCDGANPCASGICVGGRCTNCPAASTPCLTAPQEVDIGQPANDIAAGRGFTCAVDASRRVHCWGRNTVGELGGAPSRFLPVTSIFPAEQIEAGEAFACARTNDGSVFCWGDNVEGQLGTGDRLSRSAPAEVTGLPGAIDIATGDNHTCAVLDDGSVSCWGDDTSGQLGDGSFGGDRPTPAVTMGPGDADGVTAGTAHSCARTRNGEVFCWGANLSGQLGIGDMPSIHATPVRVLGLRE